METIKLPRVNIFMPFIVRDFSKMAVIGGGGDFTRNGRAARNEEGGGGYNGRMESF